MKMVTFQLSISKNQLKLDVDIFKILKGVGFVDFKKAFDSIENWAVIGSLINSRIDYRYTELITNIYKEAKTSIKLHEYTETLALRRGVKQGNTISPKLFNQTLGDVFKQLDWDKKGIK